MRIYYVIVHVEFHIEHSNEDKTRETGGRGGIGGLFPFLLLVSAFFFLWIGSRVILSGWLAVLCVIVTIGEFWREFNEPSKFPVLFDLST